MPTKTLRRSELMPRNMRVFRLRIRERGAERTEELERPLVRIGSQPGCDLVLADDTVSRIHCELTAEAGRFRLRDLGSSNGTVVDGFDVRDIYLKPGSVITVGTTQIVFEPLDTKVVIPASSETRFGALVGASAVMRELFLQLERAAPTDATVLIEGESGTGKERVAEALHAASKRGRLPWVVFDCAAVSPSLIESELFGHEKGAFTGADAGRIGCLEEADGGTLFLDEIGELPLELQPKLLRAIEKREVRRVGSNKTRQVDVRFVAATNRDLAAEVNRGTFRQDLYWRLAVVRLRLPALRERPEDIPLLVQSFLEDLQGGDAARAALEAIPKERWDRLEAHAWPGNVRELRNLIESTLALSSTRSLTQVDPVAASTPRAATPGGSAVDLGRPFVGHKAEVLASFEKAYLEGMLARHNGNLSRAADAAGIDRMYFKRLLKKHR